MTDAGMSETDLAKDLWFVRYRESSLQKRVEILRQANSPIKPWMIRAKKENFEAYVQQIFASKLDCDQILILNRFLMLLGTFCNIRNNSHVHKQFRT